jgi:hypothetical protein
MALGLDLSACPGCSINRAKPERAFLIDMSLLRLSAGSFAHKGQHAMTGRGMLAA